MTQNEMILNHMKEHDGITQAEAFRLYGCARLAARISDLREMGNDIEMTPTTKRNRYGRKVTYATYRLAVK